MSPYLPWSNQNEKKTPKTKIMFICSKTPALAAFFLSPYKTLFISNTLISQNADWACSQNWASCFAAATLCGEFCWNLRRASLKISRSNNMEAGQRLKRSVGKREFCDTGRQKLAVFRRAQKCPHFFVFVIFATNASFLRIITNFQI